MNHARPPATAASASAFRASDPEPLSWRRVLRYGGPLLLLGILAMLSACSRPTALPEPAGSTEAAPTAPDSGATAGAEEAGAEAGPLTEDQLANASYPYGDVTISLVDGQYQQKPSPDSATYIVNVSLTGPIAYGDLDGDGVEDAALVLTDEPGGSGTFVSLAAARNVDGEAEGVATTPLGDRVKVEALAIADGIITVELVTHGPSDPMCCPTQAATWRYRLEGENLVQIEGPEAEG